MKTICEVNNKVVNDFRVKIFLIFNAPTQVSEFILQIQNLCQQINEVKTDSPNQCISKKQNYKALDALNQLNRYCYIAEINVSTRLYSLCKGIILTTTFKITFFLDEMKHEML